MEDSRIIELYWARDEQAIPETDTKYGPFCRNLSKNILGSIEDAEECVNDTYLRAWNSMPPEKPMNLRAWLGRIVRNISIDLWRRHGAKKRGDGIDALLSELEECVPSPVSVENEIDAKELTKIIEGWLDSLSRTDRAIFMRRYWYGESVIAIAIREDTDANKMAGKLYRLRKSLKNRLHREGVTL